MKTALILSLLAIGGINADCVAQEISLPQPIIIQQDDIKALDNARRATCMIITPKYFTSGSAVLVSRKKLENDQYLYRAITAYHVVEKMAKAFSNNKLNVNHDIYLMFQQKFHDEPIRIRLLIDDIDWAVPAHDWAAITFTTIHRLACVEIATKTEFETIKSFEKIYAVGYGGGFGQFCRDGIIGATHNEHWNMREQINQGRTLWDKHPHNFFRPYINAWYGDSGGGIFNKHGKLIGIINGYGIMSRNGPVTYSTIALKTHIIREATKYSKDFFLIEG